MNENDRRVFFGAYTRDRRPSHAQPDANFEAFHQYRDINDSFSSDGNTLAASEYDTSYGGTTETATTYSPHEHIDNGGPSADDPDPEILKDISVMVGEFRNSSSIGSARSSPKITPQFDPDDIEGAETLTLGNPKGATTSGPTEACSLSSLDKVGRERFKKLKRSVEKYSEILDASGSESQEDQGQRTISTSRARERPRLTTTFENRHNPQTTRNHGSTGYNREPSQRNYRREGNGTPPINNTILPSQRNHGGQQVNNADTYQTAPRKRPRAHPALRKLEPKSRTHPILPVQENNHLRPPRDPAPRPGNGDFRCTVNGCTRRYNRSENLCRHLRTDHGQPPDDVRIRCPDCGATRGGGRAQENMNTHRREKHGIIIHAMSLVGRV
ncbi:uncharacterized protein DFL_003463 [Arthrobotrys flagrans]|uniref:C2H2-type domain-containing protein n=1 Tax=Arthrobotrys flagrans TaxID=97331 RepID=A0A437A203_ARTFL|nr:hypothetical protein DFL_003463 [Arthrobotrys flagrans]